MEERISDLKENQQKLGSKISVLQETNRKNDEEAVKIRELIAECRNNLDRLKGEVATNASQRPQYQTDFIRRRNKCPDEEEGRPQTSRGRRTASFSRSRGFSQSSDGSRGRSRSPCAAFKDPCGDSKNNPCESRTAVLKNQISALADAQAKSRQCIEKLGEKMEKEVRMRIVRENQNPCSEYDPCDFEADGFQERVSCRVDLSKMKVNIRGPPEDLKKLDAVQLINLLDKFQCQEIVINTGDNESQLSLQGEVPIFYFTHPGNLAVIFGIAMIAFLLKANLCTRRGVRTKLLLNMLYLGSFAFHYGIVLWMSFIRGVTFGIGLPHELFNTVDNLILPKYFSICVFLSALMLYSLLANYCVTPRTPWPLPVLAQIIIESTTFLMEIITVSYIVPAISRLREATDEYSSEDEDCPPPQSHSRNVQKLARLNRLITIINALSVLFMGSNLYYISSKLNIG